MVNKNNGKIELLSLPVEDKKGIDKWVLEVVGEGKECEKSLLTAVILFMKHYMPQHQHTISRAMSLILAAAPPKGRNPKSEFDRAMEQAARVSPHDVAIWYYKAFSICPDGVKNQSIANVYYKLSTTMDMWPTYIAENPPMPCDTVKLFNKEDASPVKLVPEEFTFI